MDQVRQSPSASMLHVASRRPHPGAMSSQQPAYTSTPANQSVLLAVRKKRGTTTIDFPWGTNSAASRGPSRPCFPNSSTSSKQPHTVIRHRDHQRQNTSPHRAASPKQPIRVAEAPTTEPQQAKEEASAEPTCLSRVRINAQSSTSPRTPRAVSAARHCFFSSFLHGTV